MKLQLPRRKRGCPTAAAAEQYEIEVRAFCQFILETASRLDFKASTRGFCYILENSERYTLRKGDFDTAQRLINECRKDGHLPWDICIEDETRSSSDLDEHETDSLSPTRKAQMIVDNAYLLYEAAESIRDNAIREAENRYATAESWRDESIARGHRSYTPFTFWDLQPYYLEMWTEKIDLRNLFKSVCDEFGIRIANAKGWNDINQRVKLLLRFAAQAARGKTCVLLYCGDHDPGGLQISDGARENLREVSGAADFWFDDDHELIIDRFGLNADFIKANNLTWIDNLETASGKPANKDLKYVREYIERFGERKVEANALVVAPESGRQLCRAAIERYLPDNYDGDYQRRLDAVRAEVKTDVQRVLRERKTN